MSEGSTLIEAPQGRGGESSKHWPLYDFGIGESKPSKPSTAERLARRVLHSPAIVRRAAATQAKDPRERWMLRQTREVCDSYVRDVLDRGGDERLAEIWMLRQVDAVRKSYVSEVLAPALPEDLKA